MQYRDFVSMRVIVFDKDAPHLSDKGVACILLMAYMKFRKREIYRRGHCQQKDLGPENPESAQSVYTTENKTICSWETNKLVSNVQLHEKMRGLSVTDLINNPIWNADSLNWGSWKWDRMKMVDRLLTSAKQDDKTTQISNTLNSSRKGGMAPKKHVDHQNFFFHCFRGP